MSYVDACELLTFAVLVVVLGYIIAVINAAERRMHGGRHHKGRRWF